MPNITVQMHIDTNALRIWFQDVFFSKKALALMQKDVHIRSAGWVKTDERYYLSVNAPENVTLAAFAAYTAQIYFSDSLQQCSFYYYKLDEHQELRSQQIYDYAGLMQNKTKPLTDVQWIPLVYDTAEQHTPDNVQYQNTTIVPEYSLKKTLASRFCASYKDAIQEQLSKKAINGLNAHYRKLDNNIKISTYSTNAINNGIMEIEAGSTGYNGGNANCGGRTFFKIANAGGANISVKTNHEHDSLEVVVSGDDDLENIIHALNFILTILQNERTKTFDKKRKD